MASQTYKCFIVDDEPLAVQVIEQYLLKFPQFEVCGTSTDPSEALTRIRQVQPDLLFLDIQMPDITGLELLEAIGHHPEVIITTAYREFAVEGFERNVLDYLVKPIPFKRFVKAIDRFLERKLSSIPLQDASESDSIFVKADRKTIRILLDNILYVEGVKDYVKIVTPERNILTKISIGNFYDQLPKERFLQVHKSFIVAKDKITAYSAHEIEIGKVLIPVGRVYKEGFLHEMEQ